MAGQRSKVQEDARFRVLRLLHDNPELSQRELAEAVGISNGSAHYLLSALLDKGLIKLGNFTAAQDKRRYAYILTPKGIAEKAAITKRFLERKIQEYDSLKAEIETLKDELGDAFAPENSPGS
ncbi:MAG: MarR family EPS-associated transcriptional regulator [Alphaproteobacteria bacterium]|uniref:MarR family EPS-associated transcriptional regulator n=1 Tax=Alexandriicola marinus TaxID=2081710 RepID=UPI000FD6E22A|nr:MarR family EPS-associated transcriptional regulator [Alexandriicola marinus]MBM1222844.1 MarR family EPS-associated transcriptional regulator [Ponticoccus sp. SC6-9]MBM1227226.1 MarR family EPS-associated transcriptional regulator [Ponticoccus sp. SC6-15]MBM1231770.1 MarR family EPS-associated transcriptional regulator [Ponticoccus sp. SC6-38]MBM1236343.1 MarR family EPS-associated transcriptional regulator [Ponticoccus sp. SC6-45]MBM1240793.1 MarR family EPS-associated transcriptional reg